MRPLFAFIAPSGAGKTAIIKGLLEKFPNQLEIVRSFTTRAPRDPAHPRYDPDDELFYQYVTHEDLAELRVEGRVLQEISYDDGNVYGNFREDVDGVLMGRCGINAMVEQGIVNFRERGYDVRIIRIVPKNWKDERTDVRRAEDEEREKRYAHLVPNLTIMNDFGRPDGLAEAIDKTALWIAARIGEADRQQLQATHRKPRGRY